MVFIHSEPIPLTEEERCFPLPQTVMMEATGVIVKAFLTRQLSLRPVSVARGACGQSGPGQPKSFSTCSFWVTCCYVTNYPKTSVAENDHHFITVHDFVGQEFQQGSMDDSSVPLGINCGHLALYSVTRWAGLEDPGQIP